MIKKYIKNEPEKRPKSDVNEKTRGNFQNETLRGLGKSEKRSLSQQRHSYSSMFVCPFFSSLSLYLPKLYAIESKIHLNAHIDGATPNAKYKTFFSSLILINLKYGIIFRKVAV